MKPETILLATMVVLVGLPAATAHAVEGADLASATVDGGLPDLSSRAALNCDDVTRSDSDTAEVEVIAYHPDDEDDCTEIPVADDVLDLVLALLTPGSGGVYTPSAREIADSRCPGGISSVDTDGDGQLDSTDEDDDCDYLADTTESTVVFSNSKDRDSDTDAIIDGYDVRPSGDATITVRIKEITVNNKMDFCTGGCGWPDPYIDAAGLFASDSVPAQVLTFAGVSESSHSHDLQTYTFGGASDSVDLPENINQFIRNSALEFPRVELRLSLVDHDLRYDNAIDISSVAGTSLWTAIVNVFNVADAISNVLEFTQNGALDGNANDSALIKIDISTNASECAISAAMKVSQNDSLVNPSEVTC